MIWERNDQGLPDRELLMRIIGQAIRSIGKPAELVLVDENFDQLKDVDRIICCLNEESKNAPYLAGAAVALQRPVLIITTTQFNLPSGLLNLPTLRLSGWDDESEQVQILAPAITAFLVDGDAPSSPSTGSVSPRVFVSYSHADSEHLKRLLVHLRPLERAGLVDVWQDTKLRAGDKWRTEIEAALARAKFAVLLVSADFLASDFIVSHELPALLKTAEAEGTRILPLILKPCRFTRDQALSEFQAVNDPSRPLILLPESEREGLYDKVSAIVEGVSGV